MSPTGLAYSHGGGTFPGKTDWLRRSAVATIHLSAIAANARLLGRLPAPDGRDRGSRRRADAVPPTHIRSVPAGARTAGSATECEDNSPVPAIEAYQPRVSGVDDREMLRGRNSGGSPGRPGNSLIAVVKADGFGHGMIPVARAALAGGARACGVTSLDEAYRLRRAGIASRIVSWLNPVDADFAWAILADVEVAVPSRAHLDAVVRAVTATGMRAAVHLHVDTGMARDGAAPHHVPDLLRRATAAENAGQIAVVGLMGHLPNAEEGPNTNDAPLAAFADATALAHRSGLRPLLHLAATAAALSDRRTRCDAVRAGAGLVGIDPANPSAPDPLHGAMTLTAPVVHTEHVRAGTAVGYGSTWRSSRRTTLALLPVGYADGIPREVQGASAWLAGRRRPVVGRVSMDQIVVDLEGDHVHPGDVATVFAPVQPAVPDPLTTPPSLADWARWAGTIPHRIVTGIGSRVMRHYEETP